MARPNWYYDHPPTCSCAECTTKRLARLGGRRARLQQGWRNLWRRLTRRRR